MRYQKVAAAAVLLLSVVPGCPRTYQFPWHVSPVDDSEERVRAGSSRTEIAISPRCELTGHNVAWADTAHRFAPLCFRDFREGHLSAAQYSRAALFIEQFIYAMDRMQCAGEQMPFPPPRFPDDRSLTALNLDAHAARAMLSSLESGRCEVTESEPPVDTAPTSSEDAAGAD